MSYFVLVNKKKYLSPPHPTTTTIYMISFFISLNNFTMRFEYRIFSPVLNNVFINSFVAILMKIRFDKHPNRIYHV